VERAAPAGFDGPATVLPGFGRGAEVGQVGVDRALQGHVAFAGGSLHLGVTAVRAQPVELAVGIEHQRRERKPPRQARGAGMQSDHEKRVPAQAEAELRIVGIAGNVVGPASAAPHVKKVQPLQLGPQQCLEARFIGVAGAVEHCGQRMHGAVVRIVVVAPSRETHDAVEQRAVVAARAQGSEGVDLQRVPRQRRLRTDAGEIGGFDVFAETCDAGRGSGIGGRGQKTAGGRAHGGEASVRVRQHPKAAPMSWV